MTRAAAHTDPTAPLEPRIAVVIPALDEEASLGAVLADIPHGSRVVVVDNGSTDRTAEVAGQGGAEVVSEPTRGYGRAVQAGIAALRADPPEVMVILDADHADDPRRIPDLVGPILRGEADMVLSDRSRTAEAHALTTVQRLGNRLATSLILGVTGHRYRDMGPFRALRWDAVEALDLQDPSWGWNVEMQIKAIKRGLRVVELPMPYRRRRAGRSKISGSVRGATRAGARILWAVGRYRRG